MGFSSAPSHNGASHTPSLQTKYGQLCGQPSSSRRIVPTSPQPVHLAGSPPSGISPSYCETMSPSHSSHDSSVTGLHVSRQCSCFVLCRFRLSVPRAKPIANISPVNFRKLIVAMCAKSWVMARLNEMSAWVSCTFTMVTNIAILVRQKSLVCSIKQQILVTHHSFSYTCKLSTSADRAAPIVGP